MAPSQLFAMTLLLSAALTPCSLRAEEKPIAADAKNTQPLKAGDTAPDVMLQSADGTELALASLFEKQPVVLVFFRGSWCPFCTRHTAELIKAYPEIQGLGAEVVGISPDSPANSKGNADKNAVPFPILSDSSVAAARAFGLAFKVDDSTISKYKGFGIDLEKASGLPHHALPIPAIYILDKTGKVVFAHSNPDYRQRLEIKTILAELKKLN